MERDERHGGRAFAQFVDIGDERDVLQEGREVALFATNLLVFTHQGPQFEDVLDPVLSVVAAVLEVLRVAGQREDLVEQFRERPGPNRPEGG